MGALTDPVWFHGERVASGDVIHLAPRRPWSLWRRPFNAIVDARDRSIPYLVFARGERVLKVPLDGAPFSPRRWTASIHRLPGIDKRRAAIIAACAAERPGEGIHHPDFDCGRRLERPGDLLTLAYLAIGVTVQVIDGRPGEPLRQVRGPQDPHNEVIVADVAGDAGAGGEEWLRRGWPRHLPWQRRSRR